MSSRKQRLPGKSGTGGLGASRQATTSARLLRLDELASVPLDWMSVGPEHQVHLSGFSCARRHFRWEVDVEAHVQTLASVRPPEYALVGSDAFGPVVVVNYWINESDASCKILVVATAARAQKSGYGREAVDHVVSLLEHGAHGVIDEAFGLVHRLNVRSKSMLRQAGFEFEATCGEELELWGRSVAQGGHE